MRYFILLNSTEKVCQNDAHSKVLYQYHVQVQNIIEKTKARDLATIIVKIVEIMLFCIDTEQFKTRTLSELVPSLTK